MVRQAYEAGVNYYDVAPTYGDAQQRLSPALEPFRKNVFLACKTAERSRQGSEKELNESLRLLRTDYLDLYQLHALTSKEDLDKAFGPDGAMETFLKAKKEGKVRYLGFSAHSVEAALAAMAPVVLMQGIGDPALRELAAQVQESMKRVVANL